MRALRDAHGVTADTIADHARRLGLQWQRSTVASIETGKRRLTGEELLLMPLVLSMALPVAVNLRELLDEEISMTADVVMTPTGFRQLLAEKTTSIYGGYKLQRELPSKAPGQRTPSVDVWRRIEQLWPQVHGAREFDLERLRAVERSAAGEAEHNAARTLGCTALDVSAISYRLWGRGLTAERDRRVEEETAPGDSPAAVRVRRGHVTRALVEKIAPLLEDQ